MPLLLCGSVNGSVITAIGLSVVLACPAAAADPATAPRASSLPWSELSYGARKFFLSASTTVRIEQVAASMIVGVLRTPPDGVAVPVPNGDVLIVATTSNLPFGRREETTVWLDANSSAALQTAKLTTGGDPYVKTWRYTTAGFFMWRDSPRDATEARQGREVWTDNRTQTITTGASPPPGLAVTDPYALLVLIARARLDHSGEKATFAFISEDRLAVATVIAGGLSLRHVDYRETWPGGARRRQGEDLVRTVRVGAHMLGEATARQNVELGFLGMRGSLTVFCEADTGLPVELQGTAPSVGVLTVRLTQAALREPRRGS
jgi:hypothetical protein